MGTVLTGALGVAFSMEGFSELISEPGTLFSVDRTMSGFFLFKSFFKEESVAFLKSKDVFERRSLCLEVTGLDRESFGALGVYTVISNLYVVS
jgi:hypothetical protein